MSCDTDQFVIRQGDLLPPFVADSTDGAGQPFDFTGWSLTFKMRGPVEVSGPAIGTANGVVSYGWVAGNTDVPGTYEAVIVGVSPPPESKPRTFPTRGAVTVVIEPA